MTDHQKETAFLRHLILFDDTNESRTLDEDMARVQRDESCIRRVASLMLGFAALDAAVFVYGMVLQDDFSNRQSPAAIYAMFGLGLASLISLTGLVVLLMVYRRKLNHLREACRQLVTNLLESRLSELHLVAARSSHAGAVEARPLPVAPFASVDRTAKNQSLNGEANARPEAAFKTEEFSRFEGEGGREASLPDRADVLLENTILPETAPDGVSIEPGRSLTKNRR